MNHVSQIMCVTGPCFDEAPSWTVRTRHEVSMVPKRISQSVDRFLAGEIGKTPALPQLDYWEMLERMTELPDHDGSAETIAELGEELGPEFVLASHRVHDLLRQQFPIASVERPAGPSNVQPSPTAWFRYRRLYEIAMHPLSVLAGLEARFLTQDHARSLQAVYPDVYNDIATALVGGIHDAASKDKEWRLSHRSDLTLQAFLMMSAISPGLAQDMQDSFKIKAPAAGGSSKAGASSAADAVATPTQRAQNL